MGIQLSPRLDRGSDIATLMPRRAWLAPLGYRNIPASQGSFAEGCGVESAIQTRTDFGVPGGYAGACPPSGETHTYALTVTALKIDRTPIDENAAPALVGFFVKATAFAQAKLVIPQVR